MTGQPLAGREQREMTQWILAGQRVADAVNRVDAGEVRNVNTFKEENTVFILK